MRESHLLNLHLPQFTYTYPQSLECADAMNANIIEKQPRTTLKTPSSSRDTSNQNAEAQRNNPPELCGPQIRGAQWQDLPGVCRDGEYGW